MRRALSYILSTPGVDVEPFLCVKAHDGLEEELILFFLSFFRVDEVFSIRRALWKRKWGRQEIGVVGLGLEDHVVLFVH